MTASPAALLVLCTCPDKDCAERLAEAAVTRRLAACVNVMPGLSSLFTWQGALDRADEVMLVAKTTPAAYPALEELWRELHPYELPEVIGVPIAVGSKAYLQWISDAVTPR